MSGRDGDTRSVALLSPQEIIQAGRWNAALFLSYALSLSFFEAAPLIALRQSGCRTVSLLTDAEGYRVSVSETGVNQVGRTYELGAVSVKGGIFHPKVMLLTGANGPRAAIGSGNLTFSGWGGNLEMLDVLTPTQAPRALSELADFLDRIQATQRVQAIWPSHLAAFIEACRLRSQQRDNGRTRLVHSLERSITDQLVDAASELGGAVSVTFVSPFFSSTKAVATLSNKLKTTNISVLIPKATPEYFPFKEADSIGLKVKPVTSSVFSKDRRRLHAKLVEVGCRRGRLLLTGSVNSTGPALTELQNIEVGVLRFLEVVSVFGWKPTSRPTNPGSGGAPPSYSKGPILVARFDGSSIEGCIFGLPKPSMKWRITLADDEGFKSFDQSVDVRSDGTFEFALNNQRHDIWGGRGALRLILTNGNREVSGWVMLGPYLTAIREHGPVVESIIRIVSEVEDSSDIETILEFFTTNPQSLISLAGRVRSAKRQKADSPGGSIDVTELAPIERDAAAQTAGSSTAQSAFEQLLERLRSYIALHPRPEIEVGEDGDDEEEAGGDSDTSSSNQKRSHSRKKSKKKTLRRKIPHEDFYRLIDAVEERIENSPERSNARRDYLITLADLGLFFSARTEEPEGLRAEFIHRWIELTTSLTEARSPPDELEQMLLQILLAGIVAGQDQPYVILSILQRRLSGHVDPAWLEQAKPDFASSGSRALIADTPLERWQEALSRVASSRTRWMDAIEAWSSIKDGREIPSTNALLREPESQTLRAAAGGNVKVDRIQLADGKRAAPACPKCHMELPVFQASRLRQQHIATADCCARVLLDLEP